MTEARQSDWEQVVARHRRVWRDHRDPIPTGIKVLGGIVLLIAGRFLLGGLFAMFSWEPVDLLGFPLALAFAWLGSSLLHGSVRALDMLLGLSILCTLTSSPLYAGLLVYLICTRPLLLRLERKRAVRLAH